jgi:Tsp45I type II restriction enzyme.
MNEWTEKSVSFASQRNYLDELYKVYPIIPNERRELSKSTISSLQKAFDGDNIELIKNLLNLEVFPLKDSYVAYMKRDRESIERNPETVNRIAGTLHQMGFEEMIDKCSQPKETNRQIGPMFKTWIDKKVLGAPIYKTRGEFTESSGNAIFNSTDAEMKKFCTDHLGYDREKGIDFVARFNDVYVVGESKFLTDFGGHQNAQFSDALSTIRSRFVSKDGNKIIPIAILDGVLYIKGKNSMHKRLIDHPEEIIISSLILREFLYSL